MILPGSNIGIIGSGQLGRMFIMAAAAMGYNVHVYSEDSIDTSPASQVCCNVTIGKYDDVEKLLEFSKNVAVITIETENIPYIAIKELQETHNVNFCPNWQALYYSQNRIREKDFLSSLDIKLAKSYPIYNLTDLQQAIQKLQLPVILKTAEMGYDGKGQFIIRDQNEINKIWHEANVNQHNNHFICEEMINFDREISIIAGRNVNNEIILYPITQNKHEDGILQSSSVPTDTSAQLTKQVHDYADKIITKLDYIGIMAIEFFIDNDDNLYVNEIAPRPHNSGHWTMDGCLTSQFEQHVRAICGLPFGDIDILGKKIIMKNIIGPEMENISNYFNHSFAKIHLYGKDKIRPKRKMGHVNYVYS
ncbi:MAG: 5-(carboxyamino)imidazole ribonucleotide synthase [Pseudomonadota bacterium]